MDIIIRNVEEQGGQYKIYNKDGTGGHWYISKESAEIVGQSVPQVMKINRLCSICREYDYNKLVLGNLNCDLEDKLKLGWSKESEGIKYIEREIAKCEKEISEIEKELRAMKEIDFNSAQQRGK